MASIDEKRVELKRRMLKAKLAKQSAPAPITEPAMSEGLDMAPTEAGIAPETQAKGFLSGLSKSATLGYFPQIAGAGEAVLGEVGEFFGGEEKPFSQRYEEEKERMKAYQEGTLEEAPIAGTVGQLAGYLAPGKAVGMLGKSVSKAVPAIGEAVAKTGAIGKSALEAGAMAGLQQQEGGVKQRMHNMAEAALTGGALTGAGKLGVAAGKQLKEAAKGMYIKGAGAMLKEFRTILDKGELDELSEFLRVNKIVGPGSSVASVVDKANAIKQQAGKRLGDLYKQAKEKLASPEVAGKISPAQAFERAGFSPKYQKDEVLSAVGDALKGKPDKGKVLRQIGNYMDELAADFGDEIDIVAAREIKSKIDLAINYARNPLAPEPMKEQGLRELRKFVNERIKDQVKLLDDVLDGAGSMELARLNKIYGNAATTVNMATDKFARENANRLFGLSEQLMSGAAGAGYGLLSGDPTQALIYGIGGAAGARLGKKYGPGVAAPMMQRGGGLIQGAGQGLMRTAPGIGALRAQEE